MEKKKGFWKKLVVVIGVIAAMGIIVMFGVSAFGDGGFLRSERELNEDNLLKVENYNPNLPESQTVNGMSVTWKDDGRLTLKGKYVNEDMTGNELYEYTFVSVTLAPGTYTLSCDDEKAGEEAYGLFAVANGSKYYVEEGSVTFDVTGDVDQAVTIGWFVKNYESVYYKTLAPILVSGEKVGSFFAD